jgi:hypothetical protein
MPFGAESFKLTSSAPSIYEGFAAAVAVGDQSVLVGVPYDGHGSWTHGGAAYLYDVTTGVQTGKLIPADGMRNDTFGVSAAIDGSRAIIGASGSLGATGAAYVFDTATGQELLKLTASNGRFGDIFGYSVDIDRNTAIVGAPRNSLVVNGKAYLYDIPTGQEKFVLEAPPTPFTVANSFGLSVALSGDRAIIGAPVFKDFDNPTGAGAAYVYDVNTGQELFRLTTSDGLDANWFGGSVAICGDLAIVAATGAVHEGLVTGAAYLFDMTTGGQIAKLVADDAAAESGFGSTVAINHNFAMIGAHRDGSESGAAYLFDLTTHKQVLKLFASDTGDGHNFGLPVSMTETHAVIGAYGANDFEGAAYLFAIPEPPSLLLAGAGLVTGLAAGWLRPRRSSAL